MNLGDYLKFKYEIRTISRTWKVLPRHRLYRHFYLNERIKAFLYLYPHLYEDQDSHLIEAFKWKWVNTNDAYLRRRKLRLLIDT